VGVVTFEDVVAVISEVFKPTEVGRHELSDEEWALVEPLLPRAAACGRPRRDDRQVVNGMFYVLRTGCPWRDLPVQYGPWKTAYNRFNGWSQAGIVDRIVEGLLAILEERGEIDWDLWCVDGSSIRAARCAAGAAKKGGPEASRLTMRSVARAVASGRRSTS
jgi:transposase